MATVETDGPSIEVGLRIDVDTYSGTRDGVPTLLGTLQETQARASFFFTFGPDNMGRHIWRLLKPAFLWKMLRSNASGLYGWDILLRGTFGPGPMIAEKLHRQMRSVEQFGHEAGLHAWDHHLWQARSERMSAAQIREQMMLAREAFVKVFAHEPLCSACAGWKCNEQVLLEKEFFAFRYNSDCRGTSIFQPTVEGTLCAPQIPVTLPTYDEIIGTNGIGDNEYNDYLLSLIKPGQLNVYTIHAEVEGISRAALFAQFLALAAQRGIKFVPLNELIDKELLHREGKLRSDGIESAPLFGREGTLCWQSSSVKR